MKKVLIYISIIAFAIGGCKKVDLDEIPSGDPVFTANATLDGIDLNLVAGDDDFYMFSEFSKDNFDVYTMTGRFAKDSNCHSDCEESLSFSIRSSYATPSVSDFIFEDAVSTMNPFSYFLAIDSTTVNGHKYTFTGKLIDTIGGVPANSYTWTISTDSNQISTFNGDIVDFDYFGSGNLEVLLTASISNGCDSYFRTTVANGGIDFCELFVEVIDTLSGSLVQLIPVSNSGLDSIFWDGNLVSGGNSSFIITPSQVLNGIIPLETLGTNCNTELGICIDASFQAITSVAFPQFDLAVEDTMMVVGNGEQFSAVTIEYQDSTGIYSSKFADNSDPNNTFTITKIEDYDDNENGEKTKKITIEYNNCILKKEGSGEEKEISGKAEIAVAYPD